MINKSPYEIQPQHEGHIVAPKRYGNSQLRGEMRGVRVDIYSGPSHADERVRSVFTSECGLS